jgi:hypothetical protein
MSSDLLAEFDSFYRAPQNATSNPAAASNDLSLLIGNSGEGQPPPKSGFPQWQSTQKTNDSIWGNMNTFQPPQNSQPPAARQGDIWASIDTLQQQSRPPILGTGTSRSGNDGLTTMDLRGTAEQDKPGILRRPTLDMFSSNMSHVDQFAPTKAATADRFPARKPASAISYGDILFDASEEQSPQPDDDDEFGEFETVTSGPPFQSPPTQTFNHMFDSTTLRSGTVEKPKDLSFASTSHDHGTLPYPQAPKLQSFQQRHSFADIGMSTAQGTKVKVEDIPKPAPPVTAWQNFEHQNPKSSSHEGIAGPTEHLDDEWGDFSPETPAVISAKASSNIKADSWAGSSVDQVTESAPAQLIVAPPTNIPPPSVFLALFPSLFDLPQSRLFTPVANQTFSLKNRIMSDPSTIEFLRAYLLIATVAARILAGRKLRWKRDTLLSQAMRIGPAAAGGKGGMKLAGLDKAEITREDREAAEVVRVWKDQLGRLRSAIAVSNSSAQDFSRHLAIPDVSETIHIKTQPGGLTAPKPCIICGLRREERANKVDIDVEDSFGEWWVDHWGHRACRNFWLEHESKLKSR